MDYLLVVQDFVRIPHLRDQVSLRDIAKRLGISRNTVRRYLRAGTVFPAYPERQSPSKLDGYAAKLSGWLKTEANRPRKQRRTLKQMLRSVNFANGCANSSNIA